jgi:uncharacterized protein DUF2784
MAYRLAADAVVAAHFGFVLFVLLGGLLALRWRRAAWAHLPALLWGIGIEFSGWVCPLTPLENRLRRRAGEEGYPGGFIAHHLLPALYPAGMTRKDQIVLGLFALVVNLLVYAWAFARPRQRLRPPDI